MPVLERIEIPIVQAPLAGGVSTPALAAAVSEAGGLGFLAAGYKTAGTVRADLEALRAMTARPFGLNVFAPPAGPAEPVEIERYASTLCDESERVGAALGEPRHDDDDWEAKLALAEAERLPLVSFTFGCPDAGVVERLHAAGSEVWVTVTAPEEARLARDAGADALVVQGVEAGGHRGSFADREDRFDSGLLALLQVVAARVDLPLVAAGGIATGRGVAAVLAAGASAAALGSALMRCPEAGTSAPHRAALATDRPTGLTRAFSGRLARGIVNRLQAEHTSAAPIAYPEINHLTAPLRAHGRSAGDPDVVNLWAGQAHELALEAPAAEIVALLHRDARQALRDGHLKLPDVL
jgi:nitronate monooxygenase